MINIEKKSTSKMLPVYTIYIVGLPCPEVFFYERAAAELNINLKVEFHGCCIDSFVDDNGIETNTAEYKSRKYEDQNLIAKQYYDQTYGENWLDQVKERAKQLVLEDQYTKLLDEYKKLEEKSKKGVKSIIYSTIILNVIFFALWWTIFNIYIALIGCFIFCLIRYFVYTKKYNKDTEVMNDLKCTIDNYIKKKQPIPTLQKAIEIAISAHQNQTDKSLYHPPTPNHRTRPEETQQIHPGLQKTSE